jgi:hypothetical protein
MDTGTRHFILRLIVGLLTFIMGVGAAMLLGGFNPFRNFSGSGYYRHHEYYYERSQIATPQPAFNYPVYRNHEGCRARGQLGELQPPRADAPMPPSQWQPLR